jgi:hypothetical protein
MRILAWSLVLLFAVPALAQTRSPDPTLELQSATDWLRRNNNADAFATERSLVLDAGSESGTRALERHGDRIDQERRLAEAEQRAREVARAEALRNRKR